jgi:uncharacterized damage-inducible protein DinB
LPNFSPLNPSLQRLFNQLEADRRGILEKVGTLSPEQFNQGYGGGWSVNQILAHLISAERLSVKYVSKKILGIQQAGNTGLWEEVKILLLRISQRLPLKFRAPKAVIENTLAYDNLRELALDWANERSELKRLLEQLEDTQLRRKIYKHIRAGRLNIRHALIFFHEHIVHHWPQIRRHMEQA